MYSRGGIEKEGWTEGGWQDRRDGESGPPLVVN
jgi:hypothetical protein